MAAVHAAGPGSGLPVGARGADAAPSGTIGAFVPVPRRTRGKLAEPDRRAAQARADVATIGILQHRAARDAAAMNEQLRRARSAVNAAAMSSRPSWARMPLACSSRVVIGWRRRVWPAQALVDRQRRQPTCSASRLRRTRAPPDRSHHHRRRAGQLSRTPDAEACPGCPPNLVRPHDGVGMRCERGPHSRRGFGGPPVWVDDADQPAAVQYRKQP